MATIVLDEIVNALEAASSGVNAYFDRKSNEVILFTEDDLYVARQDLITNVPDWQRETIAIIKCIDKDEEKRFLALPTNYDIHEWNVMRQFSLSITDAEISQELQDSLHGNGAFSQFRNCLHCHNLQEQWYEYRATYLRNIAINWCTENRIAYNDEK